MFRPTIIDSIHYGQPTLTENETALIDTETDFIGVDPKYLLLILLYLTSNN